MLRTCYSDRYGVHIPRMFHDLLEDIENDRKIGYKRQISSRADQEQNSANESDCTPRRSRRIFHVTEYDVTEGRYPQSWDDYKGYLIPGGVASACGDHPWMQVLLSEVKDLRDSGRPILAICLGHQVLAQALGGNVRQRTAPRKHYGLQESELLLSSENKINAFIRSAVARALGDKERGDHRDWPRMKLLYHHNDEVVDLPPGAVNLATSRHCGIHGFVMTASNGDEEDFPNVLTLQAHPELNYEYGRRVMDGLLDVDVVAGRLTHEKARRMKEQVSAWDHTEFPVSLELMKLFLTRLLIE